MVLPQCNNFPPHWYAAETRPSEIATLQAVFRKSHEIAATPISLREPFLNSRREEDRCDRTVHAPVAIVQAINLPICCCQCARCWPNRSHDNVWHGGCQRSQAGNHSGD